MNEGSSSSRDDVVERFLRYVRIDTQSCDEHDDIVPSTSGQFDLARVLADELAALGCTDARVSEHAYVSAHAEASADQADLPGLGLIAHLDTTQSAPGADVRPRIETYRGGDLVSGHVDGADVSLSIEEMPELSALIGEDLILTDGTTLLGADDKAGVAEIMALVARIARDPSIPHPRLGICFCPDEEIGHGAALLDLDEFDCAAAYTVDGGPLGELEWECFNAVAATVTFQGRSIHPGDAKGRMVNAANLFTEYHDLLPVAMRPEHTEGYEGFIFLNSVSATCEHATARYEIRDHDATLLDRKIEHMRRAAAFMNARFEQDRVHVAIKETYRNMAEVISAHPELIERAGDAFVAAGVEPRIIPIRGGTDGAQLSFRGLPCPNLSTGGYAYHGVHEFIPVSSLVKMVDVLEQLVRRFS